MLQLPPSNFSTYDLLSKYYNESRRPHRPDAVGSHALEAVIEGRKGLRAAHQVGICGRLAQLNNNRCQELFVMVL